MRKLLYLLIVSALIFSAQECAASQGGWEKEYPGFRVTGLTAISGELWICGAGGSIASSSDGQHWQIRHQHEDSGPLLFGIGFSSLKFGYAYGLAGAVLTTEDGGKTWINNSVKSETILAASFSAPFFGIARTRDRLLFFHGSATPHEVSVEDGIRNRFSHIGGVVSAGVNRFGVLLKEGEVSEGGFLSTTDGGKTWVFYDPPRSVIRSFLATGKTYWAVGHEVRNGLGIPLAMFSTDGRSWQKTKSDIQGCHWEVCRACNTSGCIASSTLVLDPFHGVTTFASVPDEKLTGQWAQIPGVVCTLNYGLYCAKAEKPKDVLAEPETPGPEIYESQELGIPIKTAMGLVCLECEIDSSLAGDAYSHSVRADLVIAMDGSVKFAKITGAPKAVQQIVQDQVEDWLFEPPQRNGKPAEISVTTHFSVRVPRVSHR